MALWAAGRGLAAMVFWPCDRVLGPELCKTKASCKRWQASHGVLALRQGPWTRAVQDAASWKLAAQNGQSQGLELVSSHFRRQHLALWAAGRGPDPFFTAMVFWPCDRVLRPAVQDDSQLQDAASKLEAGSAERQTKSRFGASF